MPTLADAGTVDGWIARCLEPGEPLWHRTYATRTTTLTAAAAWSGLTKFGAQAKREGLFSIVARSAAVLAVDAMLPSGETSVDLFFAGSPDLEPTGAVLAITPRRLIFLAVGKLPHPTMASRDVPLWQASWTSEQLATAPVRLRATRFIMAELVLVTLGEGGEQQTFQVMRAPNNPPLVFPDEFAQAEAIRARVEAVAPR